MIIPIPGVHCGEDVNECLETPCLNNATCTNLMGGFRCKCPVQWEGDLCELAVDFCAGDPCHGSTCVAEETGFWCNCTAGWIGKYCDQNKDECSENVCLNGATCTDTIGSYRCTCLSGFTGKYTIFLHIDVRFYATLNRKKKSITIYILYH